MDRKHYNKQKKKHLLVSDQFKSSMQALKVSEEKFSKIFHASPEVIVLTNPKDGRFLEVNDAYVNIFGFTREETIGHTVFELRIWDDLQMRQHLLGLTKQGLPIRNVEVNFYNRDHRLVPCNISAETIEIDGETCLLSIIQDITERKLAEEKLRKSEEKFRAEYKSIPIPTYTWQVTENDLTLMDYNDKAFEFTQGGVVKLLGQKASVLYRNDPGTFSEIMECAQKKVNLKYERWHRLSSSGNTKYVQIDYAFVPPDFVMVHIQDFTERKHAETALQESEERFRAAFMTSADAQVIAEMNTSQITEVNDHYLKLYGYTRKEIVGHTALELNLWANPEDRTRLLTELKLHGFVENFEVLQQRKDGEKFWVLFSATSLKQDGQEFMLGAIRDITERKQTEAILRESEEKFKYVFDHSVDGKSITFPDGRINVNHAFCEMLGYSSEELNQEVWQKITHPNDVEESEREAVSLLSGEKDSTRLIKRYIHKNGSIVWADVGVALRRDDQGNPLYFISSVLDITERKQAEEVIRNRNRILVTLHNVALQVGAELRLPELLTNVMGQAQSLLNADRGGGVYLYESEKQLLRLMYGTGINQGRDGITIRIGEGIAGRVYQTAQALVIDDYTHWEGHATVLVSDAEHPSTVMGVPLFVESKAIGVLTFIANAKFRKFNALDIQQAEMFAAQVAIAIQNAQLYRKAQNEIAERAKAQEELRSLNESLEQRVAERTIELNRINLELEHANHTKDEFLANMSHELRTPLNSILGLSESLLEQRRGPLNEYQQRSLQIIGASGQHLLELINDVLDLSKIEAGKFDYYPQVIEVDNLCRGSLAFIKEAATKKSITLTYVPETTVYKIYADPRRLKQILVNLLTNAVKFTPNQGHVTLQVHANPEQDRIQFSVIDTGIGIAPEDLKKIFQPFQQVDSSWTREYEGTGLGLSLVQKLTDLHGGSVDVESKVGHGSRFTINLSIGQITIAQQAGFDEGNELVLKQTDGASNKPAKQPTEHVTILLAEDNMSNIMTVGDYLESCGYQVIVAHDGVEAIKTAEEIHPNIILMDIQMPAMDGMEAIRRLRADTRFKTTPIIALTALAMPGDRERCLMAGASEYLSKPVSLKNLLKTIENLLQNKK